jgi:hypothetical protein
VYTASVLVETLVEAPSTTASGGDACSTGSTGSRTT